MKYNVFINVVRFERHNNLHSSYSRTVYVRDGGVTRAI